MKTKIIGLLSILCCVLFVILLVLGWQYRSLRDDRDFILRNADITFDAAFSRLYADIFQNDNTNIDPARDATYAADGKYCRILYSLSSYSDRNKTLQSIVYALAGMVGPSPGYPSYEIITDQELIDDMAYLSIHLDDEALTKEVWEALSAQLKSIDADVE
ncbi:MAG: hypothetical protein LUG13_08675 [Oscillospiraceae bacterium]|nr:hypothetical protein [Oscillospiraceae bacterium]